MVSQPLTSPGTENNQPENWKKNLLNVQLVSRMSKPTILTFDGLDVVSRVSEESRSSMDFA